jgi:tyrosinase
LPDADRVLFIKALNELYKNNEVMTMAKAYFDNRLAINGKTVSPMFLMWHRVFLFDMEEKLRALPGYECVTIPYWNYHCRIPTDRRSPVGLGDNKLGQGDKQGCIEGPFSAVKHTLGQKKAGCIKRAPVALKITNLTCSGFTDMANIGDENFDRFATRIQNLHGLVHEAYGGNFATQYSPIDPLFWLHHANVDRLWALWQDCHSNYMPPAYAGAPSNLAAPYSAVTPADILDLAQMNWKGQKYAVMYSSDDWQDVGAYSTHFRQTLITVCQAKGGLQRYAKAVPVLGPGLDDQWALVTSPGTLAAVPTAVALTCQNSVLDEKQYPVLAVYAYLSLTECLAKCDKFFFTKDGESNCKCLSGKTRNAPAVRTSVLNHPEGKPYEVPVSQYTATCDSFLFDSAIGLRSLEGFDDLESDESSSEEIVLTNRMVALPGPSQSQDVCLAWIDTAVELRAPITCSAGAPRPRLSEKWLKMNNLALDAVEPCASYTAPAGRGSIQCIYK